MTDLEFLEGFLPRDVARDQLAWERHMRVVRARDAGATLKTIGKKMGLDKERIRQIAFKGRRLANYTRSPVEKYQDLSRHRLELKQLAKLAEPVQFRPAGR
jgi:hypothetical protein